MKKTEGVRITTKANTDIDTLTATSFPGEACGIVLGNREKNLIERITSIKNSAEEETRKVYFEIDPLEMYRAERIAESEGMEIVGIFHSHPEKPAIVSKEDEKYMIPGMLYLIASATKDKILELRGYTRDTPDGCVHEVIIGGV